MIDVEPEARAPRRDRSLVVATAATALTLLDVTVVYLALPDLGRDLGATFTEQQWVVDAYAVAMAATLLVFGALADRRGRRGVFLGGLVLFGGASIACALAPGGAALAIARAFQGAGAAGLVTTSLALIGAGFDGAARGRALGMWGAVSGAALAAGPVVGGVVIETGGWRWVFALNVPIVIGLAVVTVRGVPESRDPHAQPPDIAGAAMFTAGLALVIAGLLRGPVDGWDAPTTLVALLGGAALLLAFLALELRADAPLLDPRLFANRRLSTTTLVAFLQSVAIYPMLLLLAVDLQVVHGYSPLAAGLRVLPITAVVLLVAPLAGRLTSRVPHRVPLAVGLIGIAAGLWLLRGTHPGDSWTTMLPGFLIVGAGVGILSPSLAAAMMEVLPTRHGGLASAIGNTARQAGIALGVAVLGAVFSAAASGAGEIDNLAAADRIGRAGQAAFIDGLDAALAVAAITALAGAAAAAFVAGSPAGHAARRSTATASSG
jgi:EmrB/QacA subfamily drug resistance transporter